MKVAALALLLAQASAGEVLEDDRYRFCHDDEYPMLEDERAWCEIVGDDNSRCPQLPAACKAGVEAESEPERAGQKRREPSSADDAREVKREPTSFPTAMSAFAQILFYVLIAAGILGLLWAVFRERFSGRDAGEPEEPAPEPGPQPAEEPAARVVLTDVERLLLEARRAADEGRYQEAIDLAYAAALRRLDGDGLIDMHHSRTNGDYLRHLRDHPDLAAQMRAIVRDVERVQFGASAANRGLFDAVLARVLPLATRAATLLLLLLAGCAPAGGDDAEAMGGGFSPSGTRAVMTLLEREGIEVGYRLARLDRVEPTTGTLLVLPGGGPEDGDWSAVKRWVEEGGILVLAGESPDDPELALEWGPSSPIVSLVPSGDWTWDLEGLDLRIASSTTLLPTIGDDAATVSLTRGQGLEAPAYALEQARGDGLVVAFADAQLFMNVAMAVGDNALAAMFLLEPLGGTGKVEVCTLLTGAGAETPMESIHRARLTPFIIQVLVLLTLWMLYRGVAFGQLRDPESHRRRAFADHVRALGTQYARARAAGRAAGAYAYWALDQLRDRLGRGRHRDVDQIAAAAAARSGLPVEEVSALLAAAQRASDAEGPPSTTREAPSDASSTTEREHVEVVRRLANLLAATGHGRGR